MRALGLASLLTLALLAPASAEEAHRFEYNTPHRPVFLVGVEPYWGGDGFGEFGVRGLLSVRMGRLELVARGEAPFESGGILRPDFDSYLRGEAGVYYALRRRRFGSGWGDVWQREVIDRKGDVVTTALVKRRAWHPPAEDRSGPHAGIAIAHERTLPGGEIVEVSELFAGWRWARQSKYKLAGGSDEAERLTLGLDLLRALSMRYPEGVDTSRIEEARWGGRLVAELLVGLNKAWSFTSAVELAMVPVARDGSSWPGFRALISFGVAFGI